MKTHNSTLKLLGILSLLLIIAKSSFPCQSKACSSCTFEGLVGTFPIKLRYLCNKIKETNQALKNGTPLPSRYKNRMILYGLPGNGKTTVVRKIAEESDSKLFEACGADIVQKFFGDGPNNINHLFENARDHVEKECQTAVIFIDEIDTVVKTDGENREEHLAATQKLWTELDNIKEDPRIIFMCATNNFNKLNNAFVGRFGNNKVEIPNPDDNTRREVLNYYAKLQTGQTWSQHLVDKIVKETKDLSVRDLENLVEASSMVAQLENNGIITEAIIEKVLIDIKKYSKKERKQNSFLQQFALASAIVVTAEVARKAISVITKQLTNYWNKPKVDYTKVAALFKFFCRTRI